MKIRILAIWICALLMGICSAIAQDKQSSIEGIWYVFRGKAIDTLEIKSSDGVLKGTITFDSRWTGISSEIHGLLVGKKISWSFTKKDEDGTTDYSFEGTLEDGRISGTYSFNSISSYKGIPVNSSSKDELWIAKRTRE